MRRILAVFLILLFPLNVLALSMSASSALSAGPAGHAAVTALSLVDAPATGADAFECGSGCDIDSDEPPSTADLHDLADQQPCLHLVVAGAGAVAPHAAARYCHSLPPPVKPPRLA